MAVGFFTAVRWWGAENYLIEPYLKNKPEISDKKD